MMHFKKTVGRLGVALVAAFTLPLVPSHWAAAQTTHTAAADAERRIKELEDAIQQLKRDTRGLEVREEERGKIKPVAGWQDGFFIQSPEGEFKLKLGGYAQYDGRYFLDEDRSTTQFLFRRIRPDIRATLWKYFELRFVPDFAGTSVRVFDAYLDAKFIPEFQVRAGKFKPPVGLERLQSAAALTFIERALPTNLVPTRDLGFQIQGEVWRSVLSYQAGIFNGAADLGNNDGDVNDDKEFAGRVFAHPFQNSVLAWTRGFGVGLAGSYGHSKGTLSNPDLAAYRTPGQATFYSFRTDSPATAAGTAVADGVRYRFSPQGYWYAGPFGLVGEYVQSSQGVRRGAAQDVLNNKAWQIAVMWVVTGEDASFRGVKPATSFNPFNGTFGALQLAARYSELKNDTDAFLLGFADPARSARKVREYTVGANWYLNSNVLVALNYEKSLYSGGAAAAAGNDREDEDVIMSRVQLAF